MANGPVGPANIDLNYLNTQFAADAQKEIDTGNIGPNGKGAGPMWNTVSAADLQRSVNQALAQGNGADVATFLSQLAVNRPHLANTLAEGAGISIG